MVNKNNCDLAEELQTMFDNAIADGTDELDVYSQMLEQGIGIEMVRKCLGDGPADVMERFCKEHGLI